MRIWEALLMGVIPIGDASSLADRMLQAELQKLQLLVTAQTRAYVAAFAQKKRKAVQLEAQLSTLLGSVKLIAAKQGQTDELCADLKEGLHKVVSGRRGVHLY